jgi:hypothetical protein
MRLERLAKDAESKVKGCHAAYLDAGGWFTVQGDQVDDDTRANLENVLPGENAVRVKPQVLLDAVESYRARL